MPDWLFEPGSPTQALLDAMSAMVFVVNEQVTVLEANRAATERLGADATVALNRAFGEVIRCTNVGLGLPHASGDVHPCGTSDHCSRCVIRQSTELALAALPARNRPGVITLHMGREQRDAHFLVSATRFEHGGQPLVMLILEDVSELAELRRIIPICAWCKKVRDDGEYREDLERYLRRHAILEVSHGICPDCQAREFPQDDDGDTAGTRFSRQE
jgi:hypothetical protein